MHLDVNMRYAQVEFVFGLDKRRQCDFACVEPRVFWLARFVVACGFVGVCVCRVRPADSHAGLVVTVSGGAGVCFLVPGQ